LPLLRDIPKNQQQPKMQNLKGNEKLQNERMELTSSCWKVFCSMSSSSKKKHNTMKDIVQAFHKLEFPINFLKNNLK
jgi:hypothetical protein